MNCSKITIHTETKGSIIITPIHLYQITDHQVKYVVMYNLKYVNANPEIPNIEANIPYYISDGKTNKLRANMLYPFMCYSSMNEVKNCPYDTMRNSDRNPNVYSGLLLKYNTDGNINVDKLEEDLLHTFLSIYTGDSYERERIIMINKISNKHDHANDLLSVLQRIPNLLDFMICITNDVIRDFDYTLQQTDIDNGKYRPLSKKQQRDGIEYTDLSIFGEETEYYINQRQKDDSSSPLNNHFRLVILTILNKYYKLIAHHKIIDNQSIVLEPKMITVHTFNTIVNICHKDTAKINMKNYKMISNEMIDVITAKIDMIPTIPENDKLLLQSIIKQNKKTHVDDVDDDKMYIQLLTNWNAHCLSRSVSIHNTNVFEMNIEEIQQELSLYAEFIRTLPEFIQKEINNNCNDETCEKDPLKRVMILRDKLLYVHSQFILYNYTGQLYITFKEIDANEKTIRVDVDSMETISILKSKIQAITGIDASRQHLMIKRGIITHLEDNRTIASYKITNNEKLSLSIKSLN